MFAIGIFYEQEDTPGTGQDIDRPDGAFDQTTAAPFEHREAQDGREREETGAGKSQRVFAALKVGNESPGVTGKGKSDAAR